MRGPTIVRSNAERRQPRREAAPRGIVCVAFQGADGPRKGSNPPVATLLPLPSFCPRNADAGPRERRCRMPRSLPARPSLEWLKKTAKDELKRLRVRNPGAVLAEAQLALAREYGFDSWRKLKRHVEAQERTASASEASPPPSLTRDQIVQRISEARWHGPDRRGPPHSRRLRRRWSTPWARIRSGGAARSRCTWPSKQSAATWSICCSRPERM